MGGDIAPLPVGDPFAPSPRSFGCEDPFIPPRYTPISHDSVDNRQTGTSYADVHLIPLAQPGPLPDGDPFAAGSTADSKGYIGNRGSAAGSRGDNVGSNRRTVL